MFIFVFKMGQTIIFKHPKRNDKYYHNVHNHGRNYNMSQVGLNIQV